MSTYLCSAGPQFPPWHSRPGTATPARRQPQWCTKHACGERPLKHHMFGYGCATAAPSTRQPVQLCCSKGGPATAGISFLDQAVAQAQAQLNDGGPHPHAILPGQQCQPAILPGQQSYYACVQCQLSALNNMIIKCTGPTVTSSSPRSQLQHRHAIVASLQRHMIIE